ncbi:hypothetical protein GDO78_005300 [Eleutherodactylus coqui]|uniref:Uncharacterized protein n=1 Tax=Eleutherodactylus coqui TaxID=57060 RepID=A0A8J6KF11_ELECQ|nr:hypothetical protein GDO78_005300 [Eleutherodactylus coqui]
MLKPYILSTCMKTYNFKRLRDFCSPLEWLQPLVCYVSLFCVAYGTVFLLKILHSLLYVTLEKYTNGFLLNCSKSCVKAIKLS